MFNFNTDAINTVPLNALDGQLGINAPIIAIPFELSGVLTTNEIALEAISATLSGQIEAVPYFSANGLSATLEGTINNGNIGTINITAVTPTILAYGNNGVSITGIPANLSASMISGNVGSVNITAIPHTHYSYILPNLYVDLTALTPQLSGQILNSALIQSGIIAHKSKLSGRILSGNVGALEITAHSQTTAIIAIQEGLIQINLTAIPGQILGNLFSELDITNFKAYAICADNLGVTEYTNFPFNSLVNYNGQILGSNENGLYLLTGDNADDDGTDIDSELLSGVSDLGVNQLKRASDVYFSGNLNKNGMEGIFKTATKTTNVELVRSKIFNETYRCKIPRGLKWRKIQIGLRNKDGISFELDNLELLAHQTKRKVI